MKTLVVVLFALFIGWCSADSKATCPTAGITAISTCYTAYFKNFNFSSIPDFTTYAIARENLLQTGVSAYKTMCGWANTLQTCIGSYDPTCASVDAFAQALGVTQQDAYEYLSTYGTDNWECGPGYNDVVQNYYCLENIVINHVNELITCDNQMNDSISQNGFSCSIMATYVTCYTKVYKKYCGSIGGYIGCNVIKAGTVEITPSCAAQLPPCSKSFEHFKLFGNRQKLAAMRMRQAQKNKEHGKIMIKNV